MRFRFNSETDLLEAGCDGCGKHLVGFVELNPKKPILLFCNQECHNAHVLDFGKNVFQLFDVRIHESPVMIPPVDEVTRLQCLYRMRNLSCEVTPYLSGKKWDRVQRDNEYANWLELHHILGRGKGFDVWCNWIMISAAAHKYIHDHCPDIGRVACLYAKLAKQKRIEQEQALFGGLSEKQQELAKLHGTPAEFAVAVYAAVPSMVSMDEAKAAIEKYQTEWDLVGPIVPLVEFDPHWSEISFIPGWIESREHQWRPEIQRMGRCVKKEIENDKRNSIEL